MQREKLINELKNLINQMSKTCKVLNEYGEQNEKALQKSLELSGAKNQVIEWLDVVENDTQKSLNDLNLLIENEKSDTEIRAKLQALYTNHYYSFVQFLILTLLPFADKDKLDFIYTEILANDLPLLNEKILELSQEWDELGDEYEFRT